MRAIALNRAGGLHFAGNFVDVSYDRIEPGRACLSFDSGRHLLDADGGVNVAAVALLADLTLAATVRTGLDPAVRLATVNLQLAFNGVPLAARLESEGRIDGPIEGADSRSWMAHLEMSADGRVAAFARGSFMLLPPPRGVTLAPVSPPRGRAVPAPPIAGALTRNEKAILARAEAALDASAADGDAFIRRFWYAEPAAVAGGAACTVRNGPHIANRVGHVQGGLLAGLALMTASAALPAGWMTTDAAVSFISPGEGRVIRLRSKTVHHGRSIAVLRTQATGKGGRLVMEVTSTHARRGP